MTTRRVLFLHSADEGYGSDRVLLSMARFLRKEDSHVRVLLPDDTARGWLTEELDKIGVEVSRGPLAVARRRYLDPKHLPAFILGLRAARRFARAQIESFMPDIVHVNTSAVIVGALLGPRRRFALIWHVHEIVTTPRPIARLMRWLPFRADQVIAVSDAVFRNLAASRAQRDRLTRLRNGIERRDASPKPAQPPLRVCYAGRLSEWKGYRYFLEAAIAVATDRKDIEVLVAGAPLPDEQWRLEEIESQLAEHNVGDRIKLLGFNSDLPGLLDSVHVVVVPSVLPDPLPTVVLEGMRAGCTVIATNQGGAVEMIENDASGILVDPANSEAIRDAIVRIADDPSLGERLGQAAAARVEAEFTTEVFWRGLAVVYENALRAVG